MTAAFLGDLVILLAEAGDAAKGEPDGGGAASALSMLPALMMIMVLFYFLMIRPERRKQASHKALLGGLKKNDRVVTIGGMYGVVMNVQRDADEVTLKIDEANNTKVRVQFSAIARVVADEPAAEKPA